VNGGGIHEYRDKGGMRVQAQEEDNNGSSERIGSMLTTEKSLSDDDLKKALEAQAKYRQVSVPSRLGEVLVVSKAVPATKVSKALHRQRDQVMRTNSIGQLLIELGHVTKEQIDETMEVHFDILAPLGEILTDSGICTQDQLKEALDLQTMRRIAAIRRPLSSSFDPVNVIELLAAESVDDTILYRDACSCDKCRANVLAITLNGLAPRYISDMEILVDQLNRYREEFGPAVQKRLHKAVEQVKMYPKLSCRTKEGGKEGDVRGNTMVRISNRHVHLSERHIRELFGADHALTKWKDLVQPGQYAAKETVTLHGHKGSIARVRVLGPARPDSQVEISGTDQFRLGVYAPVRESGVIDDTPGIDLEGPGGRITLERGVIRAWRHIHMTPEEGRRFEVQNRDRVNVRLKGDRSTILEDVLIRITDTSSLEMHIDTDEANAAGVAAESEGEILGRG
jgi:putative phosphotransacetylase